MPEQQAGIGRGIAVGRLALDAYTLVRVDLRDKQLVTTSSMTMCDGTGRVCCHIPNLRPV